jgi:hypothetical protein
VPPRCQFCRVRGGNAYYFACPSLRAPGAHGSVYSLDDCFLYSPEGSIVLAVLQDVMEFFFECDQRCHFGQSLIFAVELFFQFLDALLGILQVLLIFIAFFCHGVSELLLP